MKPINDDISLKCTNPDAFGAPVVWRSTGAPKASRNFLGVVKLESSLSPSPIHHACAL